LGLGEKMSRPQVDYDALASEYDQRFQHDTSPGIFLALQSLIEANAAQRMLEVGCGTGHWLALLSDQIKSVFGLDLSSGMLLQAGRRKLPAELTQGRAEQLPFQTNAFDLISCVNAVHHFRQPELFVQEAARSLRPGGLLAVIGSDPHQTGHSWYVYDYFDGTYQTDLDRFPSQERLRAWMSAAGFENIQGQLAQFIRDEKRGQEVMHDPFLRKEATSQLALLSDAAYQAGLDRIKVDLEKAAARGEVLVFQAEIQIFMTWGRLSGA
jgi:ubiquinone/menaquinone biosynthesis C-methylase UbiE